MKEQTVLGLTSCSDKSLQILTDLYNYVIGKKLTLNNDLGRHLA